jgi:hypothetical protein
MKIAFFNNQIDYRGTGNATFDYAHYNEVILGNKSLILTRLNGAHDPDQIQRYKNRFDNILYLEDGIPLNVDAIYHIKYGTNDLDMSHILPYWVHAVFDGSQPHGTRYAVISKWMSQRDNQPYVPHIVNPPIPEREDLRSYKLHQDIYPEAVVIGRYGGPDTFDIPFVWDAMLETMHNNPLIHFAFLGPVNGLPEWVDKLPSKYRRRVISLPLSVYPDRKSLFVESCDAMLHARLRGETFGIACAEFAYAGRPVITYKGSPEKAHLLELRGQPKKWFYEDKESLVSALLSIDKETKFLNISEGYAHYDPYRVMDIFKDVFING